MRRDPITTSQLERRLRQEAGGEPGLAPAFAGYLSETLRRAADAPGPPAAAATPGPRLALVAIAGGLAAAVLVFVTLAPPARQGPAGTEVTRALGAAVHESLGRPPVTVAHTMEAGQRQLAAEAQRMLADARQLARPLVIPWRGMGAGP